MTKRILCYSILSLFIILSSCTLQTNLISSNISSENISSLTVSDAISSEIESNTNSKINSENSQKTANASSTQENKNGRKYNSDGKLLIYSNKNSISPDFAKIYSTVEQLYKASKNIIYGTVKKVKRHKVYGFENSLYTFNVEKSYKGSIKVKSDITVVCSGAWVPYKQAKIHINPKIFKGYSKEELSNAVVNMNSSGSAPAPLENDRYVLFLGDTSKDEKYCPAGGYIEELFFMGRFYYVGNNLTRYKPDKEQNFYQLNQKKKVKEVFSLDELETLINSYK